ncbi:MAG: enoyl-CoA hydratase [Burkholderiaceae bacterium]
MEKDLVKLSISPATATAAGLSEPASIATLSIERAHKSNALNLETMAAFVAAVQQAGQDASVRALVVTGAGDKAFVGGADISQMADLDAPKAREFITSVHHCCDAVRQFGAPVIARINGVAFGAGLELAAACDLRVAAEDAVLGMPEVKLGIPSVVEAALLPGLIGWGKTREILMLGDSFSAQEALSWGLLNKVVPRAELDVAVNDWLTSLLANGPASVRLQKALISRWEQVALPEAVSAGIDTFASAWRSDEPAAMMKAWRAAAAERKARSE